MLTMQHAMHAYLMAGKDTTPEYLGGTLFPDAIRAYSGPRQLSHFERSDDGTDWSWWEMPTDMKRVTPESVKASLEAGSHLAWNAKAPFGMETNVDAFIEHNPHMMYNKDMYAGVLAHLSAQDMAFDSFIRWRIIDVSEMGEGRIYIQPEMLHWRCIPEDIAFHQDGGRMVFDSGNDARKLITEVEMFGVYVLAHKVYEKYGITCDQHWFDTDVAALLHEAYPDDLAEKALKYMKEDPHISELISAHDFGHLDEGPIPLEAYDRLYNAATWGTERVWRTGEPAFMFW
jgi:hypothetical protein